jgi:hypothetical protein
MMNGYTAALRGLAAPPIMVLLVIPATLGIERLFATSWLYSMLFTMAFARF